ncbi:MAG: hypothetical protein R8P61_17095 [Bacteroidia bacterium]|nr:hypothetical protein [Bacteroidia bacterium]
MDQLLDTYISILSKNKEAKTKAIFLTGSKVDGKSLDFWSDTDLVIVLERGEFLLKTAWDQLLPQLGQILAKEEHISDESLTYRLILQLDEGIERLDLSILSYDSWMKREFRELDSFLLLYGEELAHKKKEKTSFGFHPIEENSNEIHRIWFLMFECVKKFMRKDNLIGLHLLLEILKEYLVLRMKARDVELQTNIHRIGQAESLAASIEFDKLHYQDKSSLLTYMANLSTEIDQALAHQHKSYLSRVEAFHGYLEKCKEN